METNLKTFLLAIAASLAAIVAAFVVYLNSFDPPPPPEPTASISVAPASIESGSTATLTWATSNAETVTINGEPVPASGSRDESPAVTTVYTLTADTATAEATLVVTEPPPTLGVIPSFALSTAHPDWALYTSRVNQQIAGTFTEYKPTQMLCWWDGDGRTNDAARDNALAQFRAQLAASLAKWNANQDLTEFSGGQYLYAVERVRDWCLTLNWCGDQLTAQEKADAEMILSRCIANMRGVPAEATWNTTAYPWPGWAQNNPGNNYYYGHLESVVLWSLHSGEWEDHLRDVMFPALEAYFASLPGGGSQEGTYYGKSHRNLFRALWLWKEATGESVDVNADEHIAYWIAATAPGYQYHAAIGDQAMSSMPRIHDANGDYLRGSILWAAKLVDSPEARHWLTQDTHEHSRGDYWFLACDPIAGTATPASTATYHAVGVGHLFAEDAAGVMLTVAAGPLVESHDHQDQGEFQLYHGGQWRIATSNVWSTSGIRQGMADHNVPQLGASQTNAACSMAYADMSGVLTVNANLSPAYGQTVTRQIVWDRVAETVTITDSAGVFRCFVGTLPVVSGNTVTVGSLTLTGATPTVTDMEAVEPSGFNLGTAGPWRVEFAAGTPVEVSW